MGVTMKMEERVNLRLPTEVYAPYAELAELVGKTPTEMIRDALTVQLDGVESLIKVLKKHQTGDTHGAKTVFGSLLSVYEAQIDHARASEDLFSSEGHDSEPVKS